MAAEPRPRTSKLGVGVTVVAALVGLAVYAGVRFLFFGLDEATPWDKPALLVDTESGPSQVELTYDGHECRDRVEVAVEEDPSTVVVTVTETLRTLVCRDGELTSYDVTLDLDEPLGERELVDGACALGQFEEDPRCAADQVTVTR